MARFLRDNSMNPWERRSAVPIGRVSAGQRYVLLALYRKKTQTGEEHMAFSEKRKSDRKPCFFYADYAYRGRVYRDFIKNISAGGAFIETTKPIPLGQEVVLTYSEPVSVFPAKTSPVGQEIMVPLTAPVSVAPVKKIGNVAWIGPEGFGVEFRPARDHYTI